MDNQDWQITKTSISERFKELYCLSEWTDCTFSVGEHEVEMIDCHRLVLAVSSPVFAALLYGPLAKHDEIIHAPDIEPNTFKSLLRYIYCEEVEMEVEMEVGLLLYASKKYMLHHLSRLCVGYLVENLDMTNLWDILRIAESLNQDDLLQHCLRVMSQYSFPFWSLSMDHMSKTVLCRLLDQEESNLSEAQLWMYVLSWAKTECEERSIDPVGINVRALIEKEGFLKRIRFLTFTKKELMEYVVPSGLLTNSEISSLTRCIESVPGCCGLYNEECNLQVEHTKDKDDDRNVNKYFYVPPDGFSGNFKKRTSIFIGNTRCFRQILSKTKMWTYGGTVWAKVTAKTHVLVTGFEVFTRIPSPADLFVSRGNKDRYNETLLVKVHDDEGKELNRTHFDGLAEYNASQTIFLSEPVWFAPHKRYNVVFELPRGQYQLMHLSTHASNKAAFFRFEDYTVEVEDYSEGGNGFISGGGDFGFISAITIVV